MGQEEFKGNDEFQVSFFTCVITNEKAF